MGTLARAAQAADAESRVHDDHHETLRLWLRLLTCTLTIEGRVRTRLREAGPEARRLADRLTDEQIQTSAAAVHRLYREWAALPVGGTLRVTWPLHDSWLRLLCGAP